jgi:hypothetical protein
LHAALHPTQEIKIPAAKKVELTDSKQLEVSKQINASDPKMALEAKLSTAADNPSGHGAESWSENEPNVAESISFSDGREEISDEELVAGKESSDNTVKVSDDEKKEIKSGAESWSTINSMIRSEDEHEESDIIEVEVSDFDD